MIQDWEDQGWMEDTHMILVQDCVNGGSTVLHWTCTAASARVPLCSTLCHCQHTVHCVIVLAAGQKYLALHKNI